MDQAAYQHKCRMLIAMSQWEGNLIRHHAVVHEHTSNMARAKRGTEVAVTDY